MSVKRCRQCRLVLDDAAFCGSRCQHHPGEYSRLYDSLNPSTSGKAGWWTCCSRRDVAAPGCVSSAHALDEALEHSLAAMGAREGAQPLPELELPEPAALFLPAACPAGVTAVEEEGMHQLQTSDTLAGLALRYGTTPAQLLQLNGLLSEAALFARPSIRVPTAAVFCAAAPSRLDALRRLVQAAAKLDAPLSSAEAAVYLDDAVGDFALALKEMEADLAWERCHPGAHSADKVLQLNPLHQPTAGG